VAHFTPQQAALDEDHRSTIQNVFLPSHAASSIPNNGGVSFTRAFVTEALVRYIWQ